MEYVGLMVWNVEYTDEFGAWYEELAEAVQDDIDRVVGILEAKGPQVPFPYILLIGGDKTGDNRFYDTMIPVADRLYDEYIEELRKEGLLP
jgi:hypothetical protein